MSKFLYTYGTLRPGKEGTVKVPGEMYDLGWFPGIKLGSNQREVVCEKIEVNDWDAVDRYEGYNENNPEGSLYIRRPFMDGFIYEYNREVDPLKRVESGDWLEHIKAKGGRYAGRFG